MKLSDIARPPIQAHEIEGVDHAICPNHGGLIRETGDRAGRVLFCPIGMEYFRYQPNSGASFSSSLPYPKSGVV